MAPIDRRYTEVTWGLTTDHRTLWLDLKMDSIVGESSTQMWKTHIQRLKYNDPRTVIRINQLQNTHSDTFRMQDKLKQLQEEIKEAVDYHDRIQNMRGKLDAIDG